MMGGLLFYVKSICYSDSHKVVQAIAQRSQCRTIILAEYSDVAGGISDRRGGCGERDHLAALQQPAQASFAIATQPPIGWVRVVRRLVQAEQISARPGKPLSCFAPLANECPAITDCHPPPVLGDVGRGSQLEMSEGAAISQARSRDLDNGDGAARTIRLSRRGSVGHGGVGGPSADRHKLRALFMDQDQAGGGVEEPQVAPGVAHGARVLSLTVSICRRCASARYSVDLIRQFLRYARLTVTRGFLSKINAVTL